MRIAGLASTTKGFAYAVTEGPRRLVLWGVERGSGAKIHRAIDRLLGQSRPLFVAFDRASSRRKMRRGRLFAVHVERVCAASGVMTLQAEPHRVLGLGVKATNWNIASTMAEHFKELRGSLPAKRKPWQSEDDRIGIFLALATSIAAWKNFGHTFI